uniref:crystal protein-like n=1 Tax=Styela clava TaxID=7725 RepID=UPI00193A1CA5|nr:crystal protein-like [Styela clava]
MQKSVIFGSLAVGAIVLVGVTVTLVITLQDVTLAPQLDKVVVTATQGSLTGEVIPEAGMFFGIPFSQPPVGEFRWKKPRQPVNFPDGHWDATYKRPACIQICHQPAEEYSCPPPNEIDEDCLYLNIWVPSRILRLVDSDNVIGGQHYVVSEEYQNGDDNSLAVLLFLHGGNFLNGAGSATLYDNRYLADQGNIIGITMNYRMGPLGFLVQGEGEDAAIGNYGIWDQIRALEWIKENIKYFGGNPNKVTVSGQSAGCESIGVLMTSPQVEDGLFHQTIMESNPFGLPFRTWENAMEFGSRFAEAAGCIRGDMECLRKADTETILKGFAASSLEVVGFDKILLIFQPWSPVIDGEFLPDQPINLFVQGKAKQLPSIIGGTIEEAVLYVALAFPRPVSNMAYRGVLKTVMKEDYQPFINYFPPTCRPLVDFTCDNRDILSQIGTEFLFLCPMRQVLNYMETNTYFYIFNQTWSFYELWEIPMCFDAVCHAAELPYVFNVANLTVHDYDAEEKVLSERMGFYWTNFVKYGNPNGRPSKTEKDARLGQIVDGDKVGAIHWPKYRETEDIDSGTYKALQMTKTGDFVMENPYKANCDFMDELDSYGEHFTYD